MKEVYIIKHLMTDSYFFNNLVEGNSFYAEATGASVFSTYEEAQQAIDDIQEDWLQIIKVYKK